MDTFADAVTQFQSAEAGGFDLSATQAASLLNEGVKRLAARSQWIKAELELGPAVAEQEAYALPENVVKLKELAVGGVPYEETDLRAIWRLKLGRASLSSRTDGVYAERFNADGLIKTFSLWPIPEEAAAISGLAAITPPVLEGEDPLPFPSEYRRAILDYAKGIAYEDVDENPQSGTYFISRADARADELRLEAQSRIGSGPYRIPVATARGHRIRR